VTRFRKPRSRPRKDELLEQLDEINAALARLGAAPRVVRAEVRNLPRDNLHKVVALEADHVVTVTKALRGIL
jgi:hypothetical protein